MVCVRLVRVMNSTVTIVGNITAVGSIGTRQNVLPYMSYNRYVARVLYIKENMQTFLAMDWNLFFGRKVIYTYFTTISNLFLPPPPLFC